MELSIVVPLYDEEDNVTLLYEKIRDAITPVKITFEIIFVDDGSNDNTFAVAERLARIDPRLRVVKFRRNYGQTPAMAAGIDIARGSIIVTMDGDLQNDPTDIPKFLCKLSDGFDIVVGWRHNRQDKLISRKIPSRIANWIIGRVTGVPIKDNGCSLKAFRSDIIKCLPLYSEMHRFIPAVASIAGPRIAEIKVNHYARKFGKSKYGLSRVYKVLFDLLSIKTVSGFAERPLRWFAFLALPFFLLSSGILFWAFLRTILGERGSLSISGSGLMFATLCVFLVFGGGLAELIKRTGNLDVLNVRLLTAREITKDGSMNIKETLIPERK